MSVNKKITEFELTNEQKNQIEKQLRGLLETCQVYHIPMFASIAIKNDENSTEYNNIVYGAIAHDITLQDDRIQKHILVAKGFDVVPTRDSININMGSFLSNSKT